MGNNSPCHQQRSYEEAPCDTCPLWDYCKLNHAACPTFAYWALSGPAANKFAVSMYKHEFVDKPTQAIYNLIYCGVEVPPKELAKDAALSVRQEKA